MDAKQKKVLDKKVSQKLLNKSPFAHPKIPSREFIQTLQRHGVGLSKAFCERLRKEGRFQRLYDKAKEEGILITPNPKKGIGMKENLIYLTCRGAGEEGYLKLKDFIDEFIERAPTGVKQDAREYVV